MGLFLVVGILLGATRDRPAIGSESAERPPSFVHEEMVVTATRIATPAEDVPQATTVIDAATIARRSPAVLANLLRGETGVYVQQTTPGQASPVIRGLTGSSILMLVDGMCLSSSLFRPAPTLHARLRAPTHPCVSDSTIPPILAPKSHRGRSRFPPPTRATSDLASRGDRTPMPLDRHTSDSISMDSDRSRDAV